MFGCVFMGKKSLPSGELQKGGARVSNTDFWTALYYGLTVLLFFFTIGEREFKDRILHFYFVAITISFIVMAIGVAMWSARSSVIFVLVLLLAIVVAIKNLIGLLYTVKGREGPVFYLIIIIIMFCTMGGTYILTIISRWRKERNGTKVRKRSGVEMGELCLCGYFRQYWRNRGILRLPWRKGDEDEARRTSRG